MNDIKKIIGILIIGILLAGCMMFIIVNENNKLEYIKSDNLCEQQPIFLVEKQEEKYLITFKDKGTVCYQKIDNSVSFIGVDRDKNVITLFNDQKEFVKSMDLATYEEIDEMVKITEPQISKTGNEYTYTYMVDNLEHNGSVILDDETVTLIDVN